MRKLQAAGVTSTKRLEELIKGEHPEYPNGPIDVHGFDESMVETVKAALLSWQNGGPTKKTARKFGKSEAGEGPAPIPEAPSEPRRRMLRCQGVNEGGQGIGSDNGWDGRPSVISSKGSKATDFSRLASTAETLR